MVWVCCLWPDVFLVAGIYVKQDIETGTPKLARNAGRGRGVSCAKARLSSALDLSNAAKTHLVTKSIVSVFMEAPLLSSFTPAGPKSLHGKHFLCHGLYEYAMFK